jgi:hypothetical protein
MIFLAFENISHAGYIVSNLVYDGFQAGLYLE